MKVFRHCYKSESIQVESKCCRGGWFRGTRGAGEVAAYSLNGVAKAKEGEGGGVAHGGVDRHKGHRVA